MKCYAFDVDDTLEVSDGPVQFSDIIQLRDAGNITGLCGNWARVTLTTRGWNLVFSFLGPHELTKAAFLQALQKYIPADEYVMVGNDPADLPKNRMVVSDDISAARDAGWRFIRERDFAAGHR